MLWCVFYTGEAMARYTHHKRQHLLKRHWRLLVIGSVVLTVIGASALALLPGEDPKPAQSTTKPKVAAAKTPVQKPAPAPTPVPPPKPLFAAAPAWQQDFATMPNGQPDKSVWNISAADTPIYNDEEQVYTNRSRNTRIENGKLILQAYREDHAGKSYTSGRIDTKDRFKFTYGKLEANIKVPKGSGTWPAFWLLSNDQIHTNKLRPTESDWEQPRFYMKDGEIDIMEHAGRWPNTIETTAYSFLKTDEKSTELPSATDQFHVYALEWLPDRLVFTIDGKAVHTISKTSNDPNAWPFDHNMYIILNLAMGGEMGGAIDQANSQWRMEVSRISYYPYIRS
jgi:beta-glucanase (GH16 family)